MNKTLMRFKRNVKTCVKTNIADILVFRQSRFRKVQLADGYVHCCWIINPVYLRHGRNLNKILT